MPGSSPAARTTRGAASARSLDLGPIPAERCWCTQSRGVPLRGAGAARAAVRRRQTTRHHHRGPPDRVRIIDVDPSRGAGRLLGMTPGDDDAIWMARLELRHKATADHPRRKPPTIRILAIFVMALQVPSSGRGRALKHACENWLGACCWRVMHLAAILNPSVVVCVAAQRRFARDDSVPNRDTPAMKAARSCRHNGRAMTAPHGGTPQASWLVRWVVRAVVSWLTSTRKGSRAPERISFRRPLRGWRGPRSYQPGSCWTLMVGVVIAGSSARARPKGVACSQDMAIPSSRSRSSSSSMPRSGFCRERRLSAVAALRSMADATRGCDEVARRRSSLPH